MKKEKGISKACISFAGIGMILLLTLVDQGTKLLALTYLKGQKDLSLISGVLKLKYLENRGMAFGLFQGKIPALVCLCLLFFAVFLYGYTRIPKRKEYLPLFMVLFLLVSGAMGNFIDRIFRGYVVDFIYFSLMDFPIFNIADIYVVCGGILLVLMVCLKYKDEDFAFLNPRYKG